MIETKLQTIWEQLNAVLYDLTKGNPADAVEAVEDCIQRLEKIKTRSATDEETGQWVIVDYFPNSPTHVYGFFDLEAEARAYADKQGMGRNSGAYDIHMVLNAHYQERREPWE